MPPEREIVEHVPHAWSWLDRTLLAFVGMFIVGAAARVFMSNEPFDLRRFVGELLLAMLAAVTLYSFGLLQGMTTTQMMFLGSLGGLGGVRLLEWAIKIARTARDAT